MRTTSRVLLTTVIVLVGLGMSGIVGGSVQAHQQAAAAHASAKVKVVPAGHLFAFSPKTLKINVGTKVTWTNTTKAPHTISSSKKGVFNKNLAIGGKTSITFKKAGTYKYVCHFHPFMLGTIVVHK